jgi:hypothetical protein
VFLNKAIQFLNFLKKVMGVTLPAARHAFGKGFRQAGGWGGHVLLSDGIRNGHIPTEETGGVADRETADSAHGFSGREKVLRMKLRQCLVES